MGVNYRVEIADRSFNTLEVLDADIVGNISWDYNRIGGCGRFKFTLPRDYCDEKFISGDFNIKIKIRNSTTKAYDLWYQGLVEAKTPNIRGHQEVINVTGHGYQAQLNRILVDKDYSSQEVSLVVKDLLDTYVTPNTDITYDAGDIVATGFTPTSLTFNSTVKSALQTCADIVGSREYGVDKDRKFFFKERSSTVGNIFPLGAKITDFSFDQSFKDIVNKVTVLGAEVGGVPFTRSGSDASSQLKYGLREKRISNSAIESNDVADQFIESYLTEFKDVVRRANCSIVDHDTRIEYGVPIDLFQLKLPSIFYGERKYNLFLYADLISRQISRISYMIDDKRALKIKLTLGQLRPSIAEQLAQLEHEIEQQNTDDL